MSLSSFFQYFLFYLDEMCYCDAKISPLMAFLVQLVQKTSLQKKNDY